MPIGKYSLVQSLSALTPTHVRGPRIMQYALMFNLNRLLKISMKLVSLLETHFIC